MSDPTQSSADPDFVIELVGHLQYKRWADESEAVVFNPSSGNTFEIDLPSVRLLDALEKGALSVAEALKVTKISYEGLEQKLQQNKFRKDYLEPLHQLDLIRLQAL